MQTPTELWRYQRGGIASNDFIYGTSAGADDSVFVAGSSSGQWANQIPAGSDDFSAAKLSRNGTLLWSWQDGSPGDDLMRAAAAVDDGVVVAGYSDGIWNNVSSQGDLDFAAVKLDSDGTVDWIWQGGTRYEDNMRACVRTTDGNVVVAGYSAGTLNGTDDDDTFVDAVAVKIDSNSGDMIWIYQAGTGGNGGTYVYGAAARGDGAVVLGGRTFGKFGDALINDSSDSDFAVVAIDANGTELWRWQDGPPSGGSYFTACTALDDGSVILAGSTEGDWSGKNNGGEDFAMVKLSSSGVEEWRWQGGTDLDDTWEGAALVNDGSIVLAGHTFGNWTGTRHVLDGDRDFAAMAVDEDGEHLWSYQNGTDLADDFNAATVRPDGSILLAGWTSGTWTASGDRDSLSDYAAVLINASGLVTPAPNGSTFSRETPSPTDVSSTVEGSAPTLVPTSPSPTDVSSTVEGSAPTLVPTSPSPTDVSSTVEGSAPTLVPTAAQDPALGYRQSTGPMEMPTSGPVQGSTASTSRTPLAAIVGTASGIGAALLVVLCVLITRRYRRRSRTDPYASAKAPRNFPVAVPDHCALPPPPSYAETVATLAVGTRSVS